jgi:transposase-like protein
MSAVDWPSSPLDAAERAFQLLVQPPTHVGFDGRGFPGLPDEILPLDELRDLLLSPVTGVEVRDAVWRELVTRARRDGPAWVVATVGVAMPGLRRIAGMLATGWRGDTDDLDAELIVGFVARLKTIDLGVPRVCGRLIDAGLRAARKARDVDSDAQLIHADAIGPIAPIHPWDHPELVLARAVAAAVLDPDEANFIAATRLGHTTVAQVAQQLGIPASTASDWRARAERRLAQAIGDGELAFVPLRPRCEARRRRRANTTTNIPTNGSVGRADTANTRSVGRTNTARGGAVGRLLGANSTPGPLLGTQQQAFGGKTSDREAAGVGAPGIGAAPA